ncbi:MAG: hypothetical protein A2516_01340 [Alphaproteobacteria bacterium RIFOXYD12_FULL_60_8]|nr:MAG: hypothetical protein A2516_01340 [Alphaproteobacteria bacterium RIFOXYD12_FULL_60_8]
MKAGVGYSEHLDSRTAGKDAAQAAMAQGGLDRCDLVLLFSTAHHDPSELRAGVRSVVGETPRIAGGWSVGVITNEHLGYGGSQAGVALLRFDAGSCEVFAEGNLSDGEQSVGQALGRRMKVSSPEDAAVLLLFDVVDRTTGRMRFNSASALLDGLKSEMPIMPNLAGAGLCGDMAASPTTQWVDDELRQQNALALVFSDGIRMDTTTLHGCHPLSDYHTVTKSDGPMVLELDGRPAIDVIADLLKGSNISPDDYGYFVTLGVNLGGKWDDYDETAYANRLCMRADKKRGGLVMFETDLTPGTDVQLMRRSVRMDYIAPKINDVFAKAQGRTPVFALYIDCAGRAGAYAGTNQEDGTEVQKAVAGRVPLLGLYSGLEIGEVAGQPHPLNWTGVFCLFSV